MTLLRSAGELGSPHIRACGRSPTPLLSGGGADRGPQHLARTVFVAGWSKYGSRWVSRAYEHPDCPRAPFSAPFEPRLLTPSGGPAQPSSIPGPSGEAQPDWTSSGTTIPIWYLLWVLSEEEDDVGKS
jgi:hypothetical protein